MAPPAPGDSVGAVARSERQENARRPGVGTVAQPSAGELATITTAAAKGTAVSGLGSSAYFSTSGQVGRVDVFDGAYWVVATSVYFSSAEDARTLVSSAVAAL